MKNPTTLDDFIEEANREYDKIRTSYGLSLRNRLLKNKILEVNNEKNNLVWNKHTIKRINRLIKRHPSTVYIYDHCSFEPYENKETQEKYDGKCGWLDIEIALPYGIFGQLQSFWVLTILSKQCYESDMKEVLKSGGEYVVFEKQTEDPIDIFDNFYVDAPYFESEDDVIKYFKEWAKYFMPEILNCEIKFEEKEAWILSWKIKNLWRKIRGF